MNNSLFVFVLFRLSLPIFFDMVEYKKQTEPAIPADNKPVCKNEKAGRKFWCACGRSAKHPYCDGSHKGTGIRPLRVLLEEDQNVCWCACKQTKTPPYCDGSHKNVEL